MHTRHVGTARVHFKTRVSYTTGTHAPCGGKKHLRDLPTPDWASPLTKITCYYVYACSIVKSWPNAAWVSLANVFPPPMGWYASESQDDNSIETQLICLSTSTSQESQDDSMMMCLHISHLCSPNEDFGGRSETLGTCFRSAFQLLSARIEYSRP